MRIYLKCIKECSKKANEWVRHRIHPGERVITVFPSNEVILFNMLQIVNDNLRKVNFGKKYTKYTKVLPLSSAFTKVALR